MTSTADGNPLVAPRVDSTSGMDGLWLAEAIRDVTDSIQSHSWVDPTLAAADSDWRPPAWWWTRWGRLPAQGWRG